MALPVTLIVIVALLEIFIISITLKILIVDMENLSLRHKEDQICTAALFLVSLFCFGGYSSSSISETLYAAQMVPLYLLETFFNLLFAFEVRLH